MKHSLCLAAIILTFALSPLSSHADTFDFSFSGSGNTASGTINLTDQGNGSYLATSMTGIYNGVSIASLDAVNDFGGNDNLLTPESSTPFSFAGLSFQTADGAQYNVYVSGGVDRETVTGFDDGTPINFTMTPESAATPEPSTFVLIGTGLAGTAGAARRRLLK